MRNFAPAAAPSLSDRREMRIRQALGHFFPNSETEWVKQGIPGLPITSWNALVTFEPIAGAPRKHIASSRQAGQNLHVTRQKIKSLHNR